MIGKVLFTKKNTKGIWGVIKAEDGATHYFDTSCIIKGNRLKTDAIVEFDVIPSRPGKTQAINVKLVVNEKQYPQLESDKLEKLLHILNETFSSKAFVDFPCLPALFRGASIEYREYAGSLNAFIEKYLLQYCVKREFTIEGKTYPTVLIKINQDQSDKNQDSDVVDSETICESIEENNENLPADLLDVKRMYDEGDFVGILRSELLRKSTPFTLGYAGIELVLKSLAVYLDMNPEQFTLNDFHKLLIKSHTTLEIRQFKDDQRIIGLGAQSAYITVNDSEFSAIFSNVYNGKMNLNNNWNGIIERFWEAKNTLAIYLTALWIIITRKEKRIDVYVDEAFKDGKLDSLPLILEVYSDFILSGDEGVSLRLQKKIIGHCFDCNDIHSLVESYRYFDKTIIPELSEVIEYVKDGRSVSSELLISWFHSNIGEMIAEKITNYYWYNNSRNGIDSTLIRTLSTILWEYPVKYYTAIVYNQSCPLFGVEQKKQLLVDNFELICKEVQEYRKAFVLASFVYYTYIKQLEMNTYDYIWNDVREQMKNQVLNQLSDDILSSRIISIFKFDVETMQGLEMFYCEKYVSKQISTISNENSLDDYIDTCENNNLSFITQWIIKHESDILFEDKEIQFRSLLSSKRYLDALLFAKNESSISNRKKNEFIKEAINKYFEEYLLNESALKTFEKIVPSNIAVQLLLQNLTFTDSSSIMSLIIIYAYRDEWIKSLYLFAPFKKIHRDSHMSFISDYISLLGSKNIKDNQFDSHFDVIKAGLKVYDYNEFDAFIEWARSINIPSGSRNYSPKPKVFDTVFQAIIKGADYKKQWRQLVEIALRTDNKEALDTLRYTIIASYIGRYGLGSFDMIISELSKKGINSKKYPDFYISIWKGILSGEYSANFIRITRPLINTAPLTFWNVFYDVVACKNHVFKLVGFEFNKFAVPDHQVQAFYEELLKRYSYTREPVFIKIALCILSDSPETVVPMFEQFVPFCGSNHNKTQLLSTIIKLISQNKYINELKVLLSADCWRCDDNEAKLIKALYALCTNDSCFFFEDDMDFTDEELQNIFQDYLMFVKNYPDIRITSALLERIQACSKSYQYKLIEAIICLRIEKKRNKSLNKLVYDTPQMVSGAFSEREVKYYLDFMKTLHQKQLKSGSEDIVYIRNRYYRLLAAEILLSSDRTSYSDDNIIALMQRNKHFNAVFPEYKEFKNVILELFTLSSITESQLNLFIIGLISNNWEQFIAELSSFDSNSLQLISRIESYTNYRDLNIYLLRSYIYDADPVDLSKMPFIEKCSPKIYAVINEISSIFQTDKNEYGQCKEILIGICHLEDVNNAKAAYFNLLDFLQNKKAVLNRHWSMFMAALQATSYIKTIIDILAEEVRQNRVSIELLSLWQPVFVSFEETSIYFYLMSVRYAMSKRSNEAKESFAMISYAEKIPEAWNGERADLQAYLTGYTSYFSPSTGKSIASFSAEKDATDISFTQLGLSRKNEDMVAIEQAIEAYRGLLQSGVEDVQRYVYYTQLFSYIKTPDDLYDIYRSIKVRAQDKGRGRLTYNELAIEYGSLIIAYEEQLSSDHKLDILIEMFNIYSFLNEINKEKQSVISRLVFAEQAVLETPGIHFEKWIEKYDKIRAIISHSFICMESEDVQHLLSPIIECTGIVSSVNSEMKLLAALEHWRNERNDSSSSSNFENAFIRAVDMKIESLKNGVNLSIEINNQVLEDDTIFYQIINTSPEYNVAVLLSNSKTDAAHLRVEIGVNGSPNEIFDNVQFSSELVLRPNDSCGQYYKLPAKVIEQLNEGDTVTVIISVVYNNRVICNNCGNQELFRYESLERTLLSSSINNNIHYGTAIPAFSRSIIGFGREKEKSLLRGLLEDNLAIIYGPSRVGKSSLLNYLANEYFDDYCKNSNRTSIVRIRIADEQYSKNDYDNNILCDGEALHFESATQIMQYLFCAPLQVAFSDVAPIKRTGMCKTAISTYSESMRSEIMDVLQQKGSVIEKYHSITRILDNYNTEIWLLFDEFQMIVKKWIGDANELAELCSYIHYIQNGGNIKIVFCGSDELVRIFECVHDDNWSEFKIKTEETWVFVGQLSESDFASMMNDRSIWKALPDGMPWNQSLDPNEWISPVLHSLYCYTGGNAICGKIFGEELLQKVKRGEFSHRSNFYPADITKIAYELLNADASKLKSLLIAHTIKNLENELPYLIFIASELSKDINKSDVSLRRILEFFSHKDNEEIETAIKVLIARGIIKTAIKNNRFTFTTLFYYDFFKVLAPESVIQKLNGSESTDTAPVDSKTWQEQVIEILKSQPRLKRGEIVDIFDELGDEGLSRGIGDALGQGQTVNIEKNNGPVSGSQTIIQINAQTINTAFNTLLDASATSKELLEAFGSLPTINAYISDSQKQLVSEKRTTLLADYEAYDACFSETGQCIDIEHLHEIEGRIMETEGELEEICAPAEKKMISDSMSAVIASDTFMDVSEKRWVKLLKITESEVAKLRELPAEISTLMSFAIVLHNVFDEIYTGINKQSPSVNNAGIVPDKMDFCPVAIMYCKIVEYILKKKHTPLYIRGLGDKTLKLNGNAVFADLGSPDSFNDNHKELSIGSYVSHIVYLPKEKLSLDAPIVKPDNTDFQFGLMKFKNSKVNFEDNIRRLINDSDTEDEKIGPWKVHARALKIISEIRNKSAHEAAPITKDVFDWLIEVLFKKGELLRILDLSK